MERCLAYPFARPTEDKCEADPVGAILALSSQPPGRIETVLPPSHARTARPDLAAAAFLQTPSQPALLLEPVLLIIRITESAGFTFSNRLVTQPFNEASVSNRGPCDSDGSFVR